MDADYLFERGIAAKAERERALWIEPAWPAGHDARDQGIGLAADARRHFVASDPPQGGDLLGHRAADAGHGEVDARAEFAGVEPGGMDQKSHWRGDWRASATRCPRPAALPLGQRAVRE